jgi:hypothetical protein
MDNISTRSKAVLVSSLFHLFTISFTSSPDELAPQWCERHLHRSTPVRAIMFFTPPRTEINRLRTSSAWHASCECARWRGAIVHRFFIVVG